MAFCTKCGAQVVDADEFCGNCGAARSSRSTAAAVEVTGAVERDAKIRLKREHDKLLTGLGLLGGVVTLILCFILLVLADAAGHTVGGIFVGGVSLICAGVFLASFNTRFAEKVNRSLSRAKTVDPLTGQPLRMVWWFRWFTAVVAIFVSMALGDYVSPPAPAPTATADTSNMSMAPARPTAPHKREILRYFCQTVTEEDKEGPHPDGKQWDLDDLVIDAATHYSIKHREIGVGIADSRELLATALGEQDTTVSVQQFCSRLGLAAMTSNKSVMERLSAAVAIAKNEQPAASPRAPAHEMTGDEIIASAPPNTRDEEKAGLHAFCAAFRDAPESDPTAKDPAHAMALMLRADEMVQKELGEPIDRANIVVTRIAKSFSRGIYGPAECEEALQQ